MKPYRTLQMLLASSLAGVVCVFAAANSGFAEELSGLEIQTRADEVSRADTEHQIMKMILENSRGQQRIRTIEAWSKERSRDEEHRFSRFLEPSDVKDTTLLTYDYDDKDDDIWLYLPALKKVKRILSSNKDDYFMGSDFTYEDMENRDLKNWTYTLIGSETVDGVDCYVVEGVPANEKEAEESGYSKVTTWVGKKDFVDRRVDYTDKKNRLSKRLLLSEIRVIGDSGKPRPHRLLMENFITKHKTILEIRDIQLNIEVPDKVFTQRNLKQ